MTYRDDLLALSARHDALASEVATKTRELDNATRILDEAKAKARLPVLDNIRVATPCSAEWAKMTGDERMRHCSECKKTVYNLSDMMREEAETLIIAKEGKLCVRYFQRKDGTILLKDCTVGIARRRRRKVIAAGLAGLLAAGGAAIALRITDKGDKPEQLREVAGGISYHHTEELMDKIQLPPPKPIQPVQPVHAEVKGGMSMSFDHDAIAGGISLDPIQLEAPIKPTKIIKKTR